MSRTQFYNKVLGSFVGEALGDAMGYPVEFQGLVTPSKPVIFSPDDARRIGDSALFTDDTQMLIAATEGILLAYEEDTPTLALFAQRVAERFAQWYANPHDGHRSPGGACSLGCTNLAEVLRYGSGDVLQCGKPGGRGCGAAMRSAVYGWFVFEDGPAMAASHTLMTHRSRNAQASAAATAAAVQAAMNGSSPEAIAESAYTAALRYDEKCARLIARAQFYAGDIDTSADQVMDEFRGWVGDEAIAASLYAFLTYPEDITECLRLAVNTPGDSDSLGAIAGAICGAYNGFDAIPAEWSAQTERLAHIKSLAAQVTDIVCGLPDPVASATPE